MGEVRMIPGHQGGLSGEPAGAVAFHPGRDIVIVHSSDLHIDNDYTARLHGGDGTAGLACVLHKARAIGADVVVLAGDTFESNRLPLDVLARTAAVIAAAAVPVVLLPGNHDPAVPEAVYGLLPAIANLHVLGVTHEEAVLFPELGLEVWGRAHRDYGDMVPFETVRPRRTRWQVALAHGHYEPAPDRSVVLRPSWLIGDAEIAATATHVAPATGTGRPGWANGSVAAYYPVAGICRDRQWCD
jgi:hypothetical protein